MIYLLFITLRNLFFWALAIIIKLSSFYVFLLNKY